MPAPSAGTRSSFAPIPRDVLGCLVGGFEKGGTTLVKDLMRRVCRMRGCFEGGLLLVDSPVQGIPEPYAAMLLQSWALPATFLDDYRGCRTFEEGYRLLREQSGNVQDKHLPLIDKTPRYMMYLDEVLRRAPTTPVIVAIRDPALVAGSWVRLGQSPAAAAEAIRLSTDGLARAAASGLGIDRVYVIRLDDLTAAPQATLDAVAAWLGVPARPYNPAAMMGTPDASGRHDPGIMADRNESQGTFPPAMVDAIDTALQGVGPAVAWASRLRTGPLSESPGA